MLGNPARRCRTGGTHPRYTITFKNQASQSALFPGRRTYGNEGSVSVYCVRWSVGLLSLSGSCFRNRSHARYQTALLHSTPHGTRYGRSDRGGNRFYAIAETTSVTKKTVELMKRQRLKRKQRRACAVCKCLGHVSGAHPELGVLLVGKYAGGTSGVPRKQCQALKVRLMHNRRSR